MQIRQFLDLGTEILCSILEWVFYFIVIFSPTEDNSVCLKSKLRFSLEFCQEDITY